MASTVSSLIVFYCYFYDFSSSKHVKFTIFELDTDWKIMNDTMMVMMINNDWLHSVLLRLI